MDEKGFVEGVRRYMSQLREEKRYSSAKSYQDALNSFIKYSGTENISYSDINKANLHRYEAYLLENDCMRNTVSTYIAVCVVFITRRWRMVMRNISPVCSKEFLREWRVSARNPYP